MLYFLTLGPLYIYVKEEKTFNEARTYCHGNGYRLASPSTEARQESLSTALTDALGAGSSDRFWIGLTDFAQGVNLM